jgi:hypothetical protein
MLLGKVKALARKKDASLEKDDDYDDFIHFLKPLATSSSINISSYVAGDLNLL